MKKTLNMVLVLMLTMCSSSIWAQWGAPVDPNPGSDPSRVQQRDS